MQTIEHLESLTKLHASSYELMTRWLDIGYTTRLSSNALQLMTVLLRFYNPANKFVFPHQETLVQRTNTSLTSVKRGLNELIKAQLIIKTRKQTGNVYGFTPKLFELLDSSKCTVPTVQNEPCMIEQIKKTNKKTTTCINAHRQTQKADVVSLSNFSLKRVPDSIRAKKTDKNGQPIRSHEAYWNSFTNEQKRQYLEQEKAEAEEIRLKEERKKALELEKEKQKEEEARRRAELNKPLNEQFTREQAIKHVWQLRNIHRGNLKEGLTKSLAELYNLDVAYICTLSEEEARKLF